MQVKPLNTRSKRKKELKEDRRQKTEGQKDGLFTLFKRNPVHRANPVNPVSGLRFLFSVSSVFSVVHPVYAQGKPPDKPVVTPAKPAVVPVKPAAAPVKSATPPAVAPSSAPSAVPVMPTVPPIVLDHPCRGDNGAGDQPGWKAVRARHVWRGSHLRHEQLAGRGCDAGRGG